MKRLQKQAMLLVIFQLFFFLVSGCNYLTQKQKTADPVVTQIGDKGFIQKVKTQSKTEDALLYVSDLGKTKNNVPTRQMFDYGGRQTIFTTLVAGAGKGLEFKWEAAQLFGVDTSVKGQEKNAIIFEQSAEGLYGFTEASWKCKMPVVDKSDQNSGYIFTLLNTNIYQNTSQVSPSDLFLPPKLQKSLSAVFYANNTIEVYWDGNAKPLIREQSATAFNDGKEHDVFMSIENHQENGSIDVMIDGKLVISNVIIQNMELFSCRVLIAGQGASSVGASYLCQIDDINVDFIDSEKNSEREKLILLPNESSKDKVNIIAFSQDGANVLNHGDAFECTEINLDLSMKGADVYFYLLDRRVYGQSGMPSELKPGDLAKTIPNAFSVIFSRQEDAINFFWNKTLVASQPFEKRRLADKSVKVKLVLEVAPKGMLMTLHINNEAFISDQFIEGMFAFPARSVIAAYAADPQEGIYANINDFNIKYKRPFVSHIYVVDMRSSGFPASIYKTVISFQGIVNRYLPRLYIIQYEDTDEFWLNKIKDYYGINWTVIDHPDDLFTHPHLTPLCKSVVVYDGKDGNLAANNAIAQAGILDSAVIDSTGLDLFTKQYGYSVAADLRSKWNGNDLDVASLEWAIENLQPYNNPLAFAIKRGDYVGNIDLKGYDYITQNRFFVLHLDSEGEFTKTTLSQQREVLKRYFSTIAFGEWSKEVKDIRLLSEFGHIRLAMGPNTSFLSALPEIKNIKQDWTTKEIEYDPNKTYIFLSFSQGDALHFCSRDNLDHLLSKSKVDPTKRISELYPYGLMHDPHQMRLQNIVPYYLYELSPNQHFSAKGWGYANPTELEEYGFLDYYLIRAIDAMKSMNIIDFMVNDKNIPNNHDPLYKIARIVKPRSIILKHSLDKSRDFDDDVQVIEGVPVFGDPVFGITDKKTKKLQVEPTIRDILKSAQYRQFFWVFLDHTTVAEELEELVVQLQKRNLEIEILSKNDVIELYRRVKGLPSYARADE